MNRRALFVVAAAGLLGACSGRQDETRVETAKYASEVIREPSGLLVSRKQPGVLWTHNDSGGGPVLFATTVTGQLLGEFTVEGATAIDWESLAQDEEGHLYIGDIGNNENKRRDLVVYRVSEPAVSLVAPTPVKGSVPVEVRIPFYYAEQKAFPPAVAVFDSEALFWAQRPDRPGGTLYLLSKERGTLRTALYRFDHLDGPDAQPLVRLGDREVGGDPTRFGGMVTAADTTPDGELLAVLTYHAVFIFRRPEDSDQYLDKLVNRIDLDQSVTKQCEGIAWLGDALLITNEDGVIFHLPYALEPREGTFP
ncbi:MAG: hypothetical protein KC620_07790 [Myxococcales bacterium]|nr:hypothetical protein [Myxococcales bacterium]